VENVWDYPRPPAVGPCPRHVRVELAGQVFADSNRALRVLETSHPPTIYLPADNVRVKLLVASRVRSTWCEFKAAARYLDAIIDDRRYEALAWTYSPTLAPLRTAQGPSRLLPRPGRRRLARRGAGAGPGG